MIDNWVGTIHPDELPTEGTNSNGIDWSSIRTNWKRFVGFDSLDDDGGFVNMSPSELRSWESHGLADRRSVSPQEVRDRVLKAATTHPAEWESYGSSKDDDWTEMGHLQIARKCNAFNARGYGSWKVYDEYITYGDERGPSGWGIACLNWQQDPQRLYAGDFYEVHTEAIEAYRDIRADLNE